MQRKEFRDFSLPKIKQNVIFSQTIFVPEAAKRSPWLKNNIKSYRNEL